MSIKQRNWLFQSADVATSANDLVGLATGESSKAAAKLVAVPAKCRFYPEGMRNRYSP
jgi:hypothetical protein